MSVHRECCNWCMWFGPVNQDGTMRKHRPATLEDKWGRPNSVQDMSAPPCPGSNKPYVRFGCDTETAQPATKDTTMTEYGIFSDAAGGCIYAPCHSPEEAERERARLISEGEESDDLTVMEMCPDHLDEEQPKANCEDCAIDGAEVEVDEDDD